MPCTAFDRAGKDTYNGTVKCTMANVHDLATAEGNGKFISYHFISYHYDGVSILILAIVIVLIIRGKIVEDLIWRPY